MAVPKFSLRTSMLLIVSVSVVFAIGLPIVRDSRTTYSIAGRDTRTSEAEFGSVETALAFRATGHPTMIFAKAKCVSIDELKASMPFVLVVYHESSAGFGFRSASQDDPNKKRVAMRTDFHVDGLPFSLDYSLSCTTSDKGRSESIRESLRLNEVELDLASGRLIELRISDRGSYSVTQRHVGRLNWEFGWKNDRQRVKLAYEWLRSVQ